MGTLHRDSEYVDYKTYSDNSLIESFPWDEKMISIVMGYNKEMIYSPKVEKQKAAAAKETRIQAKVVPCRNCWNSDKKMLKSKRMYGVKCIQCLRCWYRG